MKPEGHLQDLRTHLRNLEASDKLVRVTRQIEKNGELMPLVRYQSRSLQESQMKRFHFKNLCPKGERLSPRLDARL